MRKQRFGDTYSISTSNYYKSEELKELFVELRGLLKSAEEAGLKDPYLVFSPSREPYEDYLGPVEVDVWGYRPLTTKEVAEEVKEKIIYALAEKLGVSFYEASVVHRLNSKGKVKLND